jgi:transketolase
LPTLDRARYAPASGVAKGAYVLADASRLRQGYGETPPEREGGRGPDVILMASGSEVSLCVSAIEPLAAAGIHARVVSMPSWELFEEQDQAYRDSVLPPSITARVAIEQASTLGWSRYAGENGTVLGMKTFGMSAPLAVLQQEFGFTIERVVTAARQQVARTTAPLGV